MIEGEDCVVFTGFVVFAVLAVFVDAGDFTVFMGFGEEATFGFSFTVCACAPKSALFFAPPSTTPSFLSLFFKTLPLKASFLGAFFVTEASVVIAAVFFKSADTPPISDLDTAVFCFVFDGLFFTIPDEESNGSTVKTGAVAAAASGIEDALTEATLAEGAFFTAVFFVAAGALAFGFEGAFLSKRSRGPSCVIKSGWATTTLGEEAFDATAVSAKRAFSSGVFSSG